MSLFQQQREQVGQLILDTSIELFRKNGYEKTTVDEITKVVGIAKGTFYNFFDSKRDVLMKWAVQVFQKLDFQQAYHNQNTFRQNIGVMIGLTVTYIQEEEALFVSFLKELATKQGVAENEEQFDFAGIMDLIADHSSDHDNITGKDKTMKINVLNDSLFMGIIRWFNSGKTADSLYHYLLDIIDICCYGILCAKEEQ